MFNKNYTTTKIRVCLKKRLSKRPNNVHGFGILFSERKAYARYRLPTEVVETNYEQKLLTLKRLSLQLM